MVQRLIGGDLHCILDRSFRRPVGPDSQLLLPWRSWNSGERIHARVDVSEVPQSACDAWSPEPNYTQAAARLDRTP